MKKIGITLIIIFAIIIGILSYKYYFSNDSEDTNTQENKPYEKHAYISGDKVLDIIYTYLSLKEDETEVLFNDIEYIEDIPTYKTIIVNNNIRYDLKTNGFTGDIKEIIKTNIEN